MGRTRHSFTTELKADAVFLFRSRQYGGSSLPRPGSWRTALRRWLTQYEAELMGQTPNGKTITAEQKRIHALETQIKSLEMEKGIFKKTATLLAEADSRGKP